VAVLLSGWKLIHDLDRDTYSLYHLEKDPGESTNLWNDDREEIAAIRARLKDALSHFPPRSRVSAPGVEMDAQTIERLRSLGYVDF
jgi:hypothetical protein